MCFEKSFNSQLVPLLFRSGGVTIGVRIVVLAGLFRIGELASLRGLLMVAERDTGRLKPLR